MPGLVLAPQYNTFGRPDDSGPGRAKLSWANPWLFLFIRKKIRNNNEGDKLVKVSTTHIVELDNHHSNRIAAERLSRNPAIMHPSTLYAYVIAVNLPIRMGFQQLRYIDRPMLLVFYILRG